LLGAENRENRRNISRTLERRGLALGKEQVGHSNVAIPKIWDEPKKLGGKMLDFRQITILFEIQPLKAQNDYMF